MKTRLPKRLRGPATIGVFAPSGTVDPAAQERATAYLQSLGHRLIVAPQVTAQWRYFAGSDRERLDAFQQMLANPDIDILMAARGGYGWTRLLEELDFEALAVCDKIIVGFSDFTAFSLAALAKSGLVTFSGPMAAVDFGNGDVGSFMEHHFWPLIEGETHDVEVTNADHGYAPQVLEGTVWGGNLSLLGHLVGTPYFPKVEGGILFAEELAEEPYAVERLFFQLHHAGVLVRQKALVLADFDECKPGTGRYPYSMGEVVQSLRELLPYPVLTGLPFGHIRDKITLPVGGHARLTILDSGYRLNFCAYNL
jgi:muramoyltetrapeptide carboxypeptidase